jgi:hypothetical protein
MKTCGSTFTQPGWTCTRTAGHEGPCAAVREPTEYDYVEWAGNLRANAKRERELLMPSPLRLTALEAVILSITAFLGGVIVGVLFL